jgi:hypothetical protein
MAIRMMRISVEIDGDPASGNVQVAFDEDNGIPDAQDVADVCRQMVVAILDDDGDEGSDSDEEPTWH